MCEGRKGVRERNHTKIYGAIRRSTRRNIKMSLCWSRHRVMQSGGLKRTQIPTFSRSIVSPDYISLCCFCKKNIRVYSERESQSCATLTQSRLHCDTFISPRNFSWMKPFSLWDFSHKFERFLFNPTRFSDKTAIHSILLQNKRFNLSQTVASVFTSISQILHRLRCRKKKNSALMVFVM